MMKNVSIIFPKKFLTIVGFLLLSSVADAQVMWNLKGGITRRMDYYVGSGSGRQLELYENDHKCTDWMAGLEMEIPLNRLLNIETGLRYRNYNTLVIPEVFSGDALYATSHFELPLRLTYKQQLGKHFSLHAGVGPYVSYAAGDDFGEKWNNNLQVGLEPSIAINWACLSLGATFNTPCFYKGYKDENKPVVMATLGIRFKSHVWKYVGATLLAIASVGAAAAVVWPTNDSYSSYNSNSYSSSNSSSSYRSSSSSSVGGRHNASEVQSKNRDSDTYSNYESQLIKMNTYWESQYNDSQRRSIQQSMKKIRTKWERRGFQMFHSQWEDWDGKKR